MATFSAIMYSVSNRPSTSSREKKKLIKRANLGKQLHLTIS